MKALLRDILFALRVFRRNPVLAFWAVVCLALGIGAATALFTLVNGILLQDLPFEDPARIVFLRGQLPAQGQARLLASLKEFLDYREVSESFEEVVAGGTRFMDLTGRGEPERFIAGRVTPGFFRMLGVEPALGQTFLPEDEVRGRGNVAILSDGLWRRRFGGEESILGETLTLGDEPYEVIGVMPPGFRFRYDGGWDHKLWVPVVREIERQERDWRALHAMARIKPGLTVEAAQQEMDAIARRFQEQYPDLYPQGDEWRIEVVPIQDEMVADIRKSLWVLFALVGLVLVIACVNVANLMMARAAERTREVSIRAALGANRRSLIRQFLTESTLLGVTGGVLGLILARFGISALVALNPDGIPRLEDVAVDGKVLLFVLGASALSVFLVGLIPAFRASRPDLQTSFKEGAATGSVRGQRAAALLAVAEVALAMVVLVGAGLLARNFLELRGVDPGFEVDNLMTVQLYMSPKTYTTDEERARFLTRMLAELEQIPGTSSVALASSLPLDAIQLIVDMDVEGHPVAEGQTPFVSDWRIVSEGYFRTMGIPLLKGRTITKRDRLESQAVAVVDEGLAERFWPGQDPMGKRVKVMPARDQADQYPWRTIVGVVGKVRSLGLAEEVPLQVYSHYEQLPVSRFMSVAVRSIGDPTTLVGAIREAIWRADPKQPVDNVRPVAELVADSISGYRSYAILMSLAAAVALILASVGVYSVIAYAVSKRTHEIGIRVAVGAQRGRVIRQIVARGLIMVGVGVGVGLALSLASNRLFSALVQGGSAVDAATLVVAGVVLLGIALVASLAPAIRAVRIDPTFVLRQQ